MKTRGHITCPRCGADVKVPLYWAVGIEGIFRCRECRLPFKTGYKMGAVLSALGLTLAVATVQLLVYLLSIYSMAIFILTLIPLWLVYGYGLRKLPRDIVFDEENDERTDSAQADRYPDLPAAGASAEWDEDGRDYRF